METTQMLESLRIKGEQLAESWSRMPGKAIRGYQGERAVNFLEGIDDSHKRAVMAQLFENTLTWLNQLDESTRTLQVGSFEKFVFPLVRAIMANLVAGDLVTVSPLDAPTGLVFYFEALYGSTKGNISRGSKMYDARRGPSGNIHYTDEIIQQEAVGTGDGATAQYQGNLTYTPVRPGTVVITDGNLRAVDNGNGALIGDVNAGGVNTVNYTTGAYDVTFNANIANATAVTVDYEYNSEGSFGTPEIDLQLTSAPVTARPNKLRCRWSIEAQQDLQAYHGINAEVEIVAFMANEIAKEINYKIVRHIQQIASAGNVVWDRTPPASVPWVWHKESLYDAMVSGSNLIFSRTQRATANWVVAGVDVCNVLETLSKFTPSSSLPTDTAGMHRIGTIGSFDVYKDPVALASDQFVMGHKGSSFLDTGYIYAPYLALYTSGTVVLDDLIARKGMVQRTGLKVVNSGMYCTGQVTQTGGAFSPT